MPWSVAVLGVEDQPLLYAISAAARPSLRLFSATDLANPVWAVAPLACMDLPLLDSIAASSLPTIRAFRPRDLVNTAWACATCLYGHAPLLKAISSAALPLLPDARGFSARELSNTAWAFAPLEGDDPPLLQAISSAALPKISAFTEQGLSTTVWAFAVLFFPDAPLLEAIASASIPSRQHFTSQGLANTSWAFSIRGVPNVPLFNALSSAARRKITDFSYSELVGTAWAFASIRFADPPLLSSIAAEAIPMLQNYHGGGNEGDEPADVMALGRSSGAKAAAPLELRGVLGLVHAMAEAKHPCLEEVLGCSFAVVERRARTLDAGGARPELQILPSLSAMGCTEGPREPIALAVHPHVCVLWKPPGWAVRVVFGDDLDTRVRGVGAGGGPEVQEWLMGRLGVHCPIARDPLAQHGLLHRLDRETSGALLWARTYLGYYAGRLQFAARRVRKVYACLCRGAVAPPPRLLDVPLLETAPPDGPPRSIAGLRGRAALTEVLRVGHLLGPEGAAPGLSASAQTAVGLPLGARRRRLVPDKA
mmetsp:Transcript_51837/g.160801  ORF Transcript_51837/g.160801 Transcript_51837/m.160801 type:complete len:537 (+) Transcript_51837:166-1776(+)